VLAESTNRFVKKGIFSSRKLFWDKYSSRDALFKFANLLLEQHS